MTDYRFIAYLLVSAGVTYLVRMLPLALVKKKIKNRFLLSFLHYIPISVLTVMTVPAIFFASSNPITAAVGFVVALVLAYFEKSLLTVASFSCLSVFIAELIIKYI